ncbi:MAG: flagellar biosynthetic protein FliQ [Phenylobacterium sp.]|jgi:flagellar biosynthetic protein FliQ
MEVDLVLTLLSNMFTTALQLALPVMMVTLVVGIIISVFQVVTQIQEMTLTFVPKIVMAVVTLGMFGHWMLRLLMDFSTRLISSIAGF